MPTLSPERISELLAPYLGHEQAPPNLFAQLSAYLDLLLLWNARTNLTAVRQPEAIVQRHFGESLFAGLHLPADAATLLDLGSGAGFPGLPIQLLRPALQVTLAESQNKKASFLREAVRTLEVTAQVWAARAEALPESQRFDVVALRAVDNMPAALAAAQPRIAPGGALVVLSAEMRPGALHYAMPLASGTWVNVEVSQLN